MCSLTFYCIIPRTTGRQSSRNWECRMSRTLSLCFPFSCSFSFASPLVHASCRVFCICARHRKHNKKIMKRKCGGRSRTTKREPGRNGIRVKGEAKDKRELEFLLAAWSCCCVVSPFPPRLSDAVLRGCQNKSVSTRSTCKYTT